MQRHCARLTWTQPHTQRQHHRRSSRTAGWWWKQQRWKYQCLRQSRAKTCRSLMPEQQPYSCQRCCACDWRPWCPQQAQPCRRQPDHCGKGRRCNRITADTRVSGVCGACFCGLFVSIPNHPEANCCWFDLCLPGDITGSSLLEAGGCFMVECEVLALTVRRAIADTGGKGGRA